MAVKKHIKNNEKIDSNIALLYKTHKYVYNINLDPIRTNLTTEFRNALTESKLLFGKVKVNSKALLKVCNNKKFCKSIKIILFSNMEAQDILKIELYDFYRAKDTVEEDIDVCNVQKEIEGYTDEIDGKHVLKKPIKYKTGQSIGIEDAKVLKLAGLELRKLKITVIDSISTNSEV